MNYHLAETRKYFQSFPDNKKRKTDVRTSNKISKDCWSACIQSSSLLSHNVNLTIEVSFLVSLKLQN